jgi:hypothetical protein
MLVISKIAIVGQSEQGQANLPDHIADCREATTSVYHVA